MKRIINEKRGYTNDELRSKAIMVLKLLGIERSETNILIMVDKLIDMITLTKSGIIFRDMGKLMEHKKVKKIIITESQYKMLTGS